MKYAWTTENMAVDGSHARQTPHVRRACLQLTCNEWRAEAALTTIPR